MKTTNRWQEVEQKIQEGVLRFAADGDEAPLRAFLRRQRRSFANLLQPQADADLSAIEALYKNRGGFILLLEKDEIFASLALLPVGEELAEIRNFYVSSEIADPELSRSLLLSALRMAHASGITRVRIETHYHQAEAYALYLSLGFQVTTEKATLWRGGLVLEIAL